jgi:hypothetical protein
MRGRTHTSTKDDRMSQPPIPPALTPEQWAQILDPGRSNGSANGHHQLSRHATAAVALYGQPYGFTHADVDDEQQVAEYCDRMADAQEDLGEIATAATFRTLAGRHRDRAAKISALLPPR